VQDQKREWLKSMRSKFLKRGRLGPGEILGVRIAKGKVFSNVEIKDYLAKEFKHFNNQIIDLEKKFPIKNEKIYFFR
jgi:glutamate synthase (NADPH/NADH) large chain